MGIFIEKREYEDLPYIEKNKDLLKVLAAFNTVSAWIEFVSSSAYAALFFYDLPVFENKFISTIFNLAMTAFCIILLAWIVSLQRIAMRKMIGSFDTEIKRDEIFYGLGIITITVFLIFTGRQGDELLFLKYNAYVPKTEEYQNNADYKEKKSSKSSLLSEKTTAISEAKESAKKCAECKVIEGDYQQKIAFKRRAKITRFKANEAEWANSKNSKIENEVSALSKEKEGKILAAQGRAEAKKDEIIAKYESLSFSADTSIAKHQAKIDSVNTLEQDKKEKQEKRNVFIAGILVYFSQFLFFVGTGGQAFIYWKANMVWHSVGGALGGNDYMGALTRIINAYASRFFGQFDIWAIELMVEQDSVLQEKKQNAFRNKSVRLAYEGGAKTLEQARYFIEKGKDGQRHSEEPQVQSESQQDVDDFKTQDVENILPEKEEIFEENTGDLEPKTPTLHEENKENSDFMIAVKDTIFRLEKFIGVCEEQTVSAVNETIIVLKKMLK